MTWISYIYFSQYWSSSSYILIFLSFFPQHSNYPYRRLSPRKLVFRYPSWTDCSREIIQTEFNIALIGGKPTLKQNSACEVLEWSDFTNRLHCKPKWYLEAQRRTYERIKWTRRRVSSHLYSLNSNFNILSPTLSLFLRSGRPLGMRTGFKISTVVIYARIGPSFRSNNKEGYRKSRSSGWASCFVFWRSEFRSWPWDYLNRLRFAMISLSPPDE
jgi:hypothetical protein